MLERSGYQTAVFIPLCHPQWTHERNSFHRLQWSEVVHGLDVATNGVQFYASPGTEESQIDEVGAKILLQEICWRPLLSGCGNAPTVLPHVQSFPHHLLHFLLLYPQNFLLLRAIAQFHWTFGVLHAGASLKMWI